MATMFYNANLFNQDIGIWHIGQVKSMSNMLDGTALSINNYNAVLAGWSSEMVQKNVTLGAEGLIYTNMEAHDILTNPLTNNWIILGDKFLPSKIVCFKENTKILTDNGYKVIQDLKKGDLVKTLKNGFLPINTIGQSIINNIISDERITDKLYIYTNIDYPEIFEPLILTGGHSILIDEFRSAEEKCKAIKILGGLYGTDDKLRLPACVDERSNPYENEGIFKIYHIALDNSNETMNYGIYANGLLVESCPLIHIKEIV
jgi:hypothetical protein